MATIITKCKCMACSLHFEAFSWQEDWLPQFCPECGSDAGFMVWRDLPDTRQIFEFVPGAATLVGLGVTRENAGGV